MMSIPQRSSSRPSTPHRLIKKSALGQQSPKQHYTIDGTVPLSDEQFIELSDSFAVLDDNLIKINLINESVVKFNESFSSLLYGLLTNSYCTEFTEAPTSENFNETYLEVDSRIRERQQEIDQFILNQNIEKHKLKEKTALPSKINQDTTRASQFKKPLTSATLSRLSKQKASGIPTPKAFSKSSTVDAKTTSVGDASYMTNDSFIENPVSKKNVLKRKGHFGTGGSSSSSSSRIPVREKPAWK